MADEFGLTKGQNDNFAIWGWSYDQLWVSDQERFEEEFPCDDCQLDESQPSIWRMSEAALSVDYHKYAPVWEFACWIFDQLSDESAAGAEHGRRWNETYLLGGKGEALTATFSRKQLAEAYEVYGISAVYRIAIFAAAKAGAGKRGQLGRPTIAFRKEIEKLQVRLSVGQALAQQKPLDRQIWALKGNGCKPAAPAPKVQQVALDANPDLPASFFAQVS